MSLSANHDVGVLIEGFEHPPVVDMGHSRGWQGALAEACGLVKEKDVHAWRYDVKDGFNARTENAWQKLAASPEVTLRSVRLRRMREELGLLMDIYNETWAGKWAYVPLTAAELDKIAADRWAAGPTRPTACTRSAWREAVAIWYGRRRMGEQAHGPAPRDVNAKRVRSFAGWRALITGGSSGIGLELARALLREGALVCVAARDEQRLSAAVEDLRASLPAGGKAPCAVRMDVADPESVVAGVEAAIAALGGLDLLVNNAGYALPGYIDELDDRAYVEMMAVNYFGAMRLSRQCLSHFIAQGGGRIVNVTSMLGFMGTFGYSAYCASKYALAGFTEALRQDALPFGVRVHLCYPPTTNTPGLERENRDKPPEAWAIEGKSRAFASSDVAKQLLAGVRAGRFHVLIGWDSWFIWVAQRFVPWLVRIVIDRVLLKELRAREPGRALALPSAE